MWVDVFSLTVHGVDTQGSLFVKNYYHYDFICLLVRSREFYGIASIARNTSVVEVSKNE